MKEQVTAIWLLVFAGALNSAGQIVMRWGGQDSKVPFSLQHMGAWMASSRWWLLGLLISWCSGLFWALLLRTVRLTIAMPIFVGVSYMLTVVASTIILHERPTGTQYIGLTLVMVGILLIVMRR